LIFDRSNGDVPTRDITSQNSGEGKVYPAAWNLFLTKKKLKGKHKKAINKNLGLYQIYE